MLRLCLLFSRAIEKTVNTCGAPGLQLCSATAKSWRLARGRELLPSKPAGVAVRAQLGLEFPELKECSRVQLQHDMGHLG